MAFFWNICKDLLKDGIKSCAISNITKVSLAGLGFVGGISILGPFANEIVSEGVSSTVEEAMAAMVKGGTKGEMGWRIMMGFVKGFTKGAIRGTVKAAANTAKRGTDIWKYITERLDIEQTQNTETASYYYNSVMLQASHRCTLF